MHKAYLIKTTISAIATVAVCTLSSCATLLTKSKADITIDGNVSTPVNITSNADTAVNVTLPYTVKIKKQHLEMPIKVSADTTLMATIYTGRKINGITWFNFAGVYVGMIADGLTGKIYKPCQTQFTISNQPGQVLTASCMKKTTSNDYRHEISANLGIDSNFGTTRFRNMRDDIERQPNIYNYDNTHYLGPTPLNIQYFYHFDQHIAAGVEVGFVNDYTHFMYDDQQDNRYTYGSLCCKSTYGMASAKYYWTMNVGNYIHFYCRAAIGAQQRDIYFRPEQDRSHHINKQKRWLLAWQISPLCFEFGIRNLRTRVEIGGGIDGNFSFGVSYFIK